MTTPGAGYASFHASDAEIHPGMVVRLVDGVNRDVTVEPACADRFENVSGIYGMATHCPLSPTSRDCDVCGSGQVSLYPSQWELVGVGKIVPGQIYYLSDRKPGHLSTELGNFVAPIAVGLSSTSMRLKLGPVELRLSGRIVESAWIREDRKAFALVFADGEQQAWNVASGSDDDSCSIVDIFQSVPGKGMRALPPVVEPANGLRGALTDYYPGTRNDQNGLHRDDPRHQRLAGAGPITHEIMVIGGVTATFKLSGQHAMLGARGVTQRWMLDHEKWTEV